MFIKTLNCCLKLSVLISLLLINVGQLNAQNEKVVFKVEVSSDTIYYGNLLLIKYTMENIDGDFHAPYFEDWHIVGGPNTTSQYSMINGIVSQSASYEYILRAVRKGNLLIDSAVINDGEKILRSDTLSIAVLPNPNNIEIKPRGYGFGQEIIFDENHKKLSPQDSLKLKMRKLKIKSTKI